MPGKRKNTIESEWLLINCIGFDCILESYWRFDFGGEINESINVFWMCLLTLTAKPKERRDYWSHFDSCMRVGFFIQWSTIKECIPFVHSLSQSHCCSHSSEKRLSQSLCIYVCVCTCLQSSPPLPAVSMWTQLSPVCSCFPLKSPRCCSENAPYLRTASHWDPCTEVRGQRGEEDVEEKEELAGGDREEEGVRAEEEEEELEQRRRS